MTDIVPADIIEGLTPDRQQDAQDCFAERIAICVEGGCSEAKAVEVAVREVRARVKGWAT